MLCPDYAGGGHLEEAGADHRYRRRPPPHQQVGKIYPVVGVMLGVAHCFVTLFACPCRLPFYSVTSSVRVVMLLEVRWSGVRNYLVFSPFGSVCCSQFFDSVSQVVWISITSFWIARGRRWLQKRGTMLSRVCLDGDEIQSIVGFL